MGKRTTVYIPDELWGEVQQRTEREGVELNLSEFLQENLERWLKAHSAPTEPPVDAGLFNEIRDRMLNDAQETYERGFALGLRLVSQLSWSDLEALMTARNVKSSLGFGEVLQLVAYGTLPNETWVFDEEQEKIVQGTGDRRNEEPTFEGADYRMASILWPLVDDDLLAYGSKLEGKTFREGVIDAFDAVYREVQDQRKARIETDVPNLKVEPPF